MPGWWSDFGLGGPGRHSGLALLHGRKPQLTGGDWDVSTLIQALEQGRLFKLNAFEIGVNRLSRSLFQPRRRFDLRLDSAYRADVGLLVLRQFGCCLRYAVEIVNDDIGVKKSDHRGNLFRPLVAQGPLQSQPIALGRHFFALRPKPKTRALRRRSALQHQIYGAAHGFCTADFFSFGPRVEAAGLAVFKVDDGSHDE